MLPTKYPITESLPPFPTPCKFLTALNLDVGPSSLDFSQISQPAPKFPDRVFLTLFLWVPECSPWLQRSINPPGHRSCVPGGLWLEGSDSAPHLKFLAHIAKQFCGWWRMLFSVAFFYHSCTSQVPVSLPCPLWSLPFCKRHFKRHKKTYKVLKSEVIGRKVP